MSAAELVQFDEAIWDEVRLMCEERPALETFTGGSRVGKGSQGRRLVTGLATHELAVLHIDQGIKFRGLTVQGQEAGVDITNPLEVAEFVDDPATADLFLHYMKYVSGLNEKEIDKELYNPRVQDVCDRVGQYPPTHDLVIATMNAEVEQAAADGFHVIALDGRGLEGRARDLHDAGVVRYVSALVFECDAFTAARRDTQLFGPLKEMTDEQKILLAEKAENFANRTAADEDRPVDRQRRPSGATSFDMVAYASATDEEKRNQARWAAYSFSTIFDTKRNSIDEIAEPVLNISRFALAEIMPNIDEHMLRVEMARGIMDGTEDIDIASDGDLPVIELVPYPGKIVPTSS